MDETQITAINPYDSVTITRESFIKQYGKAAERFISQLESEVRANIVKKIESLQENGYIEIPWEMLVKELGLSPQKDKETPQQRANRMIFEKKKEGTP